MPACAGTVRRVFRTGGWRIFKSTNRRSCCQKAYFFFAAFFFVAFFFVAFFLAAFFLVAIMDLHVGLIRGASIYMLDGNASKRYARASISGVRCTFLQ